MKKITGISFLLMLVIVNGCGRSSRMQDQFLINQLSGNYRTSYNGDVFRTRSYEGIRRYYEDNVAVVITDSEGKSRTMYTRYINNKPNTLTP